MYNWRNISNQERAALLAERKVRSLPWHSPPHLEFEGFVTFIITAACYEHVHIIGKNSQRMTEFQDEFLTTCERAHSKIFAWCILPNHYHLLARTDNIKLLRKEIGKIHGRTARLWNQEDFSIGRKVWFNFFDREMRSPGHFWASMNYINHNAVRHGYVKKWQDWPFSSANNLLESLGREAVSKIWREYPILDYGKDWDVY